MAKPRRPKGGRSNWQPKPPLDAGISAPTEPRLEEAAVPDAAPSPTGFADAEPVPAAAPEAASVAPAGQEAQAAPAEPEAETPDSAVDVVNPDAADRGGDAHREHPDEHRAAEHAEPEMAFDAAPPPDLAPVPVMPRAAEPSVVNRIAFAPDRIDMTEIGSTIARYVQGEGAAALAHFRALSDARTPADLIRLQVGEVQRAADASLTCWVTVIGKASRVVAFR